MPTDFTGLPTTGNREYDAARISTINEKLKERNLSKEDRAVIISSIIEESGGDPFAKSKGGTYQGLLQWGADRYRPRSSKEDEELDNQVQYIVDTINNAKDGKSWTHGGKGSGYNSAKETYSTFHNNSTFDDKFKSFSYGYVRPHGKENSYKNILVSGKYR